MADEDEDIVEIIDSRFDRDIIITTDPVDHPDILQNTIESGTAYCKLKNDPIYLSREGISQVQSVSTIEDIEGVEKVERDTTEFKLCDVCWSATYLGTKPVAFEFESEEERLYFHPNCLFELVDQFDVVLEDRRVDLFTQVI